MTNQSFNAFSSGNSNSHSSSDQNFGTNENSSFSKVSVTLPSHHENIQFSKNGGRPGSSSAVFEKKAFAGREQQNPAKARNTTKRKVFSVSQILARVNKKKQRKFEQKKRKKPFKPIIPPKSFLLLFQEKPEKYVYNRRIIDYKHCGLLQRYIGLGGKILPRRQTKLTAKQQRYVAKTIKSARIMGLLPFVTKERGFFR
jgi:small subunit ribosomal protein S18